MREKIEAFIDDLQHNKKKANNTLIAYRRDVSAFAVFLREHSGRELLSCRDSDAVAYVLELNNKHKSKATINRKLSALRMFYAYMLANGEVESNPFLKIKSARNDHRRIDFLTVEELERLLALPDDSVKGIRDRALLEFLYGTGARVTELVRLRFSDLNLRMNFVTLRDGEGESRIVPIGSYAHAALQRYLDTAYHALQPGEDEDAYVFVNFRGLPLTRQGVWKILKEYGDQMGLRERMTPQLLRNSFAVHILQNGGDLRTLQELMGFDDMSVGIAYLSVLNVRIKDVFNRTHPRA